MLEDPRGKAESFHERFATNDPVQQTQKPAEENDRTCTSSMISDSIPRYTQHAILLRTELFEKFIRFNLGFHLKWIQMDGVLQ